MGDRAECPVCLSYSSSILYAINHGDKCPTCGCDYEFLVEYQKILEDRESYSKRKLSQVLIEDNARLVHENFKLRSKMSRLVDILGYDYENPIRRALDGIIKIIHEDL